MSLELYYVCFLALLTIDNANGYRAEEDIGYRWILEK